ncbi:uncharacterized protein LOC129598331 [Paramacrobiotus metropolitanus]|uniref:uncharacterized protein LOC129598331 n=1 Tax=Paramacrobiotus metropolitanus TaxID=2943436 RepID=UPI0024456F8A|nr:uncharacterized protein LOC129598331 [Paramacrobiotus metropolitanus]
MSPEMLAASGPMESRHTWPRLPGCATDVWSAGCILLLLVRGVTGDYRELLRHPVSGAVRGAERRLKDAAVAAAVLQGYVPLVPDAAAVPPELSGCIRHCLCTAADQRITARQLCECLSRIN